MTIILNIIQLQSLPISRHDNRVLKTVIKFIQLYTLYIHVLQFMYDISIARFYVNFCSNFPACNQFRVADGLADVFRSCASMKFVNFPGRSNIFNPSERYQIEAVVLETIDSLLPPFCHCQSLLTGLHDYRATVTTVNQ